MFFSDLNNIDLGLACRGGTIKVEHLEIYRLESIWLKKDWELGPTVDVSGPPRKAPTGFGCPRTRNQPVPNKIRQVKGTHPKDLRKVVS